MNITSTLNGILEYVTQKILIGKTYSFFFYGKDNLSNIPSDLFKEITDDLPLKETRALSLTCRTIFKIVDPLILLKTQWLLENLESSLLLDNIFEESLKNPQDLEKYNDFKVKSKKLSNGSREKCQALRNLICLPFEKGLLVPLVIFKKAPSLHNDFLITQLIQMRQGTDENLGLYCDCSDKDHVDSILLYLNVLLKNQIQPNKVQLRFEGNPYESNILEMFVKAIQVNHSIHKVILIAANWDILHLGKFLDGIKNVEHISEVSIAIAYRFGGVEGVGHLIDVKHIINDKLDGSFIRVFDVNHIINDKLDGSFIRVFHEAGTFTYMRLQDDQI